MANQRETCSDPVDEAIYQHDLALSVAYDSIPRSPDNLSDLAKGLAVDTAWFFAGAVLVTGAITAVAVHKGASKVFECTDSEREVRP